MKTLKLDCFLTKVRASRHIKCILPHIHKFIFETVQKQHVLYSFKAMADTTDKDKLYLLHARVKGEDFCDVLEMKLTSPLGGIQQVGASETTAKTVAPLEKTTTKKKTVFAFSKIGISCDTFDVRSNSTSRPQRRSKNQHPTNLILFQESC